MPVTALHVHHDDSDAWTDFRYDFTTTKVRSSPHDLWQKLRQERPVSKGETRGEEYLFVSTYEGTRSVAQDPDRFTTTQGVAIPRTPALLLPVETDGVRHRELRRIINPVLAPQNVSQWEGWLRERARTHVAELVAKERFDLCQDFGHPYVKNCMLTFLGFPEEDLPRLHYWTWLLQVPSEALPAEETARIQTECIPYIAEHLQLRRGMEKDETALSVVAHGDVDGEPLTEEEQLSMMLLLMVAALSTTSAVLAGSLAWLADHPEDRFRLRQNPELLKTAVDEFVRFVSPVAHMARTVTEETVIEGFPVQVGDRIVLGFGSANRDVGHFETPDMVDLGRNPNRHLGFGIGPHRCVGLHLAKLVLRVGIDEFLKAMPDFHVVDHEEIRTEPTGFGRELRSVPVAVGLR